MAELTDVHTCPICGSSYTFDSDGVPFHLECDHDGDHDVCDPDDRHIP